MKQSSLWMFLLALVWSTACAADIKSCPSICVEARIMDDHWVLMTVDSSGRVLQMQKTDARAEQPLKDWFSGLLYDPLDSGTRDAEPMPPPSGTGTVSVDSHYPGSNGDQQGYWFVNIDYIFVNFELVDVKSTVFFKQAPVPPPGDDQMN